MLYCTSQLGLLTLRMQCLKQALPDPLVPLHINGTTIPRYIFIYDSIKQLSLYSKHQSFISLISHYLNVYRINPRIDIQFVLVSVIFGRSPGTILNINKKNKKLKLFNGVLKCFKVLFLGRNTVIRFSEPLSLRDMIRKYGFQHLVSEKFSRVAAIYFRRQHLAASGPPLIIRQDLFNILLMSKEISKAVEYEARTKKISIKKAQKNAVTLMEEIASNFSYVAIYISDKVLSRMWKILYQGLNVCNAERVRHLAETGYEIVYLPCHRSHMDYLLLSYVIYHQGLAPPHIASGINLNFWPAGQIFRRLGAFFIRRNVKYNKLYSNIFREYLNTLLIHGYSVEYFIEGSRSRTGKLLEPKTGTLTITLQSMLRGVNKPIVLVPIYVGYEHIIEVATFFKELSGVLKNQEGFWQMLRGLRRLRYLGQAYINFGEPLPIAAWLSEKFPKWRETIHASDKRWIGQAANNIATTIMQRINNAAATNAINLCSTVLLSSYQYTLTRSQCLLQLTCYLKLLRNVPYSPDITITNLTPDAILAHAMKMKKLTIKYHDMDEIIFLSRDQALLMTYYRNNIHHLFVLPSLVAKIIYSDPGILRSKLYNMIVLLYPFLKAELFMCYNKTELLQVVEALIYELSDQGLIKIKDMLLYPTDHYSTSLKLLANNINETLHRYAIIFLLLRFHSKFNRSVIEIKSKIIAKQFLLLHRFNDPDFFSKSFFSALVATLRSEKYINDSGEVIENFF